MPRPTYLVLIEAEDYEEAVLLAEDAVDLHRGLMHNSAELLELPRDTENWQPPVCAAELGAAEFIKRINMLRSDATEERLLSYMDRPLSVVLKSITDSLEQHTILEGMRAYWGGFTWESRFLNGIDDTITFTDDLIEKINRNPEVYWLMPFDLRV